MSAKQAISRYNALDEVKAYGDTTVDDDSGPSGGDESSNEDDQAKDDKPGKDVKNRMRTDKKKRYAVDGFLTKST